MPILYEDKKESLPKLGRYHSGSPVQSRFAIDLWVFSREPHPKLGVQIKGSVADQEHLKENWR